MSTELALINQEINQLKSMIVAEKSNRLTDSLFSKDLAPHYMQLASKLSSSTLVPKAYQGKPHDLFIAMALGYQIGLPVEQAIQCIAVINGKPCMYGDEMLALCMVHPDFVDIIEMPILDDNTIVGYNCTIKRKNKADHTVVFTLNDAKKAGLFKNPVWNNYPSRMLQMRARAFALRDKFPDALKGIKSREEIEDYIEAEFASVPAASRTEILKNDLLNKVEKSNAEIPIQVNSFTDIIENPETGKEATSSENNPGVDEVTDDINRLHSEITELLENKGFTEERLIKALHYYEVDCIESLNQESSKHFISILNNL